MRAVQLGIENVEFGDAFAEDRPGQAGWADVIADGVINLCADKRAVFAEITR